MTLLQVQNLRVYYTTKTGVVKAVDDVSFDLKEGESLGLAGESGCGKTTTALTLTKLLPYNGKIQSGKIIFDGTDLAQKNEEYVRKNIRWKRISIIFQGAMNALNPIMRVGDQIVEPLTMHRNLTKEEAWAKVEELFKTVGLDPLMALRYPFEFSGGMRQRAMIAMALSCTPDLIIADEPSTALDVIVAAQVLDLMRQLRTELGLTMILISHDLSIIAETCTNVAIMYAGKIDEIGDAASVFLNPLHPYTQGLMKAFPSVNAKTTQEFVAIPGSPPDLIDPPPACRFHPRCPYAWDLCRSEEPPLISTKDNRLVACHLVAGRDKRG
jgi:peptide/nickel transport system ATP-binding protein